MEPTDQSLDTTLYLGNDLNPKLHVHNAIEITVTRTGQLIAQLPDSY